MKRTELVLLASPRRDLRASIWREGILKVGIRGSEIPVQLEGHPYPRL
jgi:hypothetical protein